MKKKIWYAFIFMGGVLFLAGCSHVATTDTTEDTAMEEKDEVMEKENAEEVMEKEDEEDSQAMEKEEDESVSAPEGATPDVADAPASAEATAGRPEEGVMEKEAEATVHEIAMVARKWVFEPDTITVKKGDTVKLTVESVDVTHGFALPAFGINENLTPGKTVEIEFVADNAGTFPFACSVVCGSGHKGMTGELIVEE